MFDGDQGVVSLPRRADELIELALQRRHLPALRVLDHEDHDERRQRRGTVQRDLPPVWKSTPPADDDPATAKDGCEHTRHGVRRSIADAVKHPTSSWPESCRRYGVEWRYDFGTRISVEGRMLHGVVARRAGWVSAGRHPPNPCEKRQLLVSFSLTASMPSVIASLALSTACLAFAAC